MQNDPSLSTLFPNPPQICYRKNPTLAGSLVKASLPGSLHPPIGQVPPIPMTPAWCDALTSVERSALRLKEDMSCFQRCPTHHTPSFETKKRVPLYRHFARKSHDFLRDHRIVPLEHCEPDALPEREAYWIRTPHTLIPHGLNSAYGTPYYPYDHSLLPLSLPAAGTHSPPWNTTQRLFIITPFLTHVEAGFFGGFPEGFLTSGFSLVMFLNSSLLGPQLASPITHTRIL